MKNFYTPILFSILFFSTTAVAQIPNGGFETWTAGLPDGWSGFNIKDTSDANSGSSAIFGQAGLRNAAIQCNVSTAGPDPDNPYFFPSTVRAVSFTGFYKFIHLPNNSDTLQIIANFSKLNVIIGSDTLNLTESASDYTQFTAPITWTAAGAPDSAMCLIAIVNRRSVNGGLGTTGTTFQLDDVSFSTQSGVGESYTPGFSLTGSEPNPVFTSSRIFYSLATDGPATLALFDVTGKQIAILASGNQMAGNHFAYFDGSGLSAGVYFYRLATADQTTGKWLQLIK